MSSKRCLFWGLLLGIVFISSVYSEQQYFSCPDSCEKPQISWSGFVNTDGWFDTRQTITSRNGHELLFPERESLDTNNMDINDHPDFGITPFAVRLVAKVSGPELLCSNKTEAVFSGDFRGISDSVNPVLRFRKGYVNFDWGNYALLIGQTDHPLYVSDCKANTVSYGRAAPIDTRARAPQVKFTWRPLFCEDGPSDEIITTFYSQSRNGQSPGPTSSTNDTSVGSRRYIQNGVMPAMDLQWRKFHDRFLFGVGVNLKRITPRLSSVANNMTYKDSKSIMSSILYGYMTYKDPGVSIRTKAMYVHDGSELGLISGYAVETQDTATNRRIYTNLRSFSFWIDADSEPEDSCYSYGFLVGVARNLGADKRLFRDDNQNLITFTGRSGSEDIRLLSRFAPRARFTCGPVTFGAEVEWTRADYGTPNDFGVPCPDPEIDAVNNVRFLTNVYYYF